MAPLQVWPPYNNNINTTTMCGGLSAHVGQVHARSQYFITPNARRLRGKFGSGWHRGLVPEELAFQTRHPLALVEVLALWW